MKKNLIFICLLFFIPQLKAQYIEHDIQLSYGVITSNQIRDIFEDMLVSIFSFGTYEKEDYKYTGAKFITYKNAVTYRLNVGATLGFDNVSGDLLEDNIKIGNFKESHTTFAAESDLRWVKRDFLQIYCGIGLGYTFSRETGTVTDTEESGTNQSGHLALQINPLGIRLGKSFGGFMEFGYGYKGILNFGFSYQFE